MEMHAQIKSQTMPVLIIDYLSYVMRILFSPFQLLVTRIHAGIFPSETYKLRRTIVLAA